MIDPQSYMVSVRLVQIEDTELYEGRVREFPDIVEYAETVEGVHDLVVDTIEGTLEELGGKDKYVPVPREPLTDCSGRVTLRLPISLHCALAEAASDEDTSLNQFLVAALSNYIGARPLWRKSMIGSDEWQSGITMHNTETVKPDQQVRIMGLASDFREISYESPRAVNG